MIRVPRSRRPRGPALAGGLFGLVGAPVAVLVDAASYVFSGLMLLGVRIPRPVSGPRERRSIRADVIEGRRWVCHHLAAGVALALGLSRFRTARVEDLPTGGAADDR